MASRWAGRTAKHFKGQKRQMGGHSEEKIPGNVPMEVGLSLAIGIAGGIYVRNWLNNDIKSWAPSAAGATPPPAPKPAAAPTRQASGSEKAAFDAWVQKMKDASPSDPKDTDDFKYITFTERPPFTASHKSLMSKVLTQELFDQLKDKASSKGFTFSNAIQCGVLKPHLGVGATAGDEECFELFKDLYYPIVKGWHKFDPYTQVHKSDLNPANVHFSREQQILFDKYVVSTRVRAARNVSGFALPSGANPTERLGVENVLKQAFTMFDGELKGKYYPLGSLTKEEEDFLQSNGFLFQKPGPAQLLAVAGAARSWPDNRGIFHNDSRTALAWCNEEDHCRIISMQNGGDVWSVFARFCKISDTIQEAAKANGADLMYSDKLGFLGTCPSNLGTGLRASVMIRLPELNKDPVALEKICDEFDLQPRGSSGEHSAAVGAKWDVSNKQRIGFTEVELVQKMIDGVTKIIAIEQKLADNPGLKPMQAMHLV